MSSFWWPTTLNSRIIRVPAISDRYYMDRSRGERSEKRSRQGIQNVTGVVIFLIINSGLIIGFDCFGCVKIRTKSCIMLDQREFIIRDSKYD